MKIRSDFVSNSSSTSFVVAINKDYDLYDFCEDIAKETINEKYENHDKELKRLNQINLAFCLRHFELVHLGSFLVESEETIIRKDELPKKINEYYTFDKAEWEKYENDIADWNIVKDHPERPDYAWKSEYKDNYIENDVLHIFNHHWFGNAVVDLENDYSMHDFLRDTWFEKLIDEGKGSEQQVRLFDEYRMNRIKKIKEIANSKSRDDIYHKSDTYQITMNTIKNTKDMISAGIDIKLEKWEDIEDLEKRLKAGEKIFMIRNNHSGDGYLSDGIYSEDDSPMLDGQENIAMEYLHSEGG